ncbi:MAG: serine hydrolase domain-containing protein [Actinomycetota bacterium]
MDAVSPPSDQLVTPGFEKVAERAWSQIRQARGGALCVMVGGRPVLDLWGGPKDPKTGEQWESDTMGMAFSVSKGVVSTLAHQLIEQGALALNAPIADYWPEFAANGKATTTVRHAMAMEAGLHNVRDLVDDPELLIDWDVMTSRMAAAAPAHAPGRANAYHAITYGWLVGELVRRVTGRSVGEQVQAALAEPLGLDGCHIGVPTDQLARVAARPVMPPEGAVLPRMARAADPVLRRAGVSPRRMAEAFLPRRATELIGSDRFLTAEVPGANGVYTARSLARLYAALGSDDGLDGVQLWRPETRRQATERQNRRRDLVLAIRMRWRLGYHQPIPRRKMPKEAFGFYGAFGSGAFADPTRELAVGFVCRQAVGMPLSRIVPSVLRAIDR